MSIKSIGIGLKTALEKIEGLRVYAPDELPDTISDFPLALILPGETNYNATFDGDYDFTFRILILLAKQDLPSAFSNILDYIENAGDESIKAKIETDPTLGGACDASRLIRNIGIGATNWGGTTYLSTEFILGIYA